MNYISDMATKHTPKSATRRAAIYTRISLDKSGERLGVQRQLEDCTALAERLGWEVVEHFDDNDLSAYSGRTRPGFEGLLDALKRGEVDALICWHPDRLYRTLKDLVRLLDLATGVEIRTVNGGDLDLSTATGKMLATILGSVSFNESAHKSERQRRAARQKAQAGLPQWTRAFGYLGPTRQPDPKIAPLVAEAYAAVLAGGSISDVARGWNKAEVWTVNGKPWTPQLVSQFLRKPRNAGLRDHNDELVIGEDGNPVKGTWAGLVDEDTWRAVRAKLDARNRGPRAVRQHLLTGVLMCGKPGCGGSLSGNWVRQATGRPEDGYSIAYSCKACRGVSVRAEHVEPMVYKLIGGRLAMADAVDLLKSELHDTEQAEQLRGERATLLARLDEIADERADGLLTGPQAKRATDRVGERLADIERRQQDQERVRVFDGLPLGKPEVVDAVKELSGDRLRTVIAVLVRITVAPCGKGGHRVDPLTKRKVINPERLMVRWL
jgi:DNA invertase Pin-like site-specific DNA recombinase